MCCVDERFNGDKDCRCYRAVMKTYNSLIDSEQPETIALYAAKMVYKYHHPEDMPDRAALIVERWVAAEHLH